jgi:hypothetical protein
VFRVGTIVFLVSAVFFAASFFFLFFKSLPVTTLLGMLTCAPALLTTRRRKGQLTEPVSAGSTVKASLRTLGSGTLEFADNTIKFHMERGYFKKHERIAREIPITDVENIEQAGNELRITWKGVTDTYDAEKKESAGIIYERVAEALKEQRKILEDEETTKQKRNELAKTLNVAMRIVDSLFDVLRSLHGRADWNRVEGYLKRSEENVGSLTSQKTGTVNLEFTKLSSTIKERLPEEISKEVYNILKSLYEYFSGLTKNEFSDQVHPNYQDAKTTITAYYTLNDIILGTVVGDEEIGKETDELVTMLEDLSKATDLKIDVDTITDIVNKLVMKKGEESVIQESRALFKQQLKELTTA